MSDLYPVRVYPVEERNGIDWVAEYPDLPGCIGVGDSREDALAVGEANKEAWLAAARRSGDPIPDPSKFDSSEFSGRFNLRLPRSLHRDLSLLSQIEDVSLNTLCVKLLSESITGKFCLESILDHVRHHKPRINPAFSAKNYPEI